MVLVAMLALVAAAVAVTVTVAVAVIVPVVANLMLEPKQLEHPKLIDPLKNEKTKYKIFNRTQDI